MASKGFSKELVALIKLKLRNGQSQASIARELNLKNASQISMIKSGKIYADVLIDDQGNLIEPEPPKPEDFPCIMPVYQEIKEEPVEDETTPYRQAFIEEYFERKGKFEYQPKSVISKSLIRNLWGKNKSLFNGDRQEYMSVIMFTVTRTVMRYLPDEQFDWKKVSIEGTAENKKLHSYLNRAIKSEVREYMNRQQDVIRILKDGKNVYAKPERTSLHSLNEEGDEIMQTVDSSFWGIEAQNSPEWEMNQRYYNSHFLQFFKDEHKEILTDSNIHFLNVMKFFQADPHDKYILPYEHLDKELKPYASSSILTKHKQAIKKKVEDAYNKVNPLTLRQLKHQKEFDFWFSYLQLVDQEHDDEQGRLSRWLKNNNSSIYIADMCWQLSPEEVLGLRKEVVPVHVLYRIVDYANARIEKLDKLINSDKKIIAFPNRKEKKAIPQEGARMVILPSGNFELINGGLADG